MHILPTYRSKDRHYSREHYHLHTQMEHLDILMFYYQLDEPHRENQEFLYFAIAL